MRHRFDVVAVNLRGTNQFEREEKGARKMRTRWKAVNDETTLGALTSIAYTRVKHGCKHGTALYAPNYFDRRHIPALFASLFFT
jgi:hypothetical protein